jgi:hypothetical protein
MACTASIRFEILYELLVSWTEYAKIALLEDHPMPQMPNA